MAAAWRAATLLRLSVVPMDIRQLRYAVLSADLRSFSRAADKLNIKQATLSRSVMQLENRLGLKLFERSTRGAEPTATGRIFVDAARRILTDLENLLTTARAVGEGEQGRISVGFCSSLMAGNLKLVFSDFVARYPEVQLHGVEGVPDKLCRYLQSRAIDVAVAPIESEEPGICTRPVWSERLVVALPKGHHLCDANRIYWSDLRHEQILLSAQGIGPTIGNAVTSRLTALGFRPNLMIQDTSLDNQLSAVPVGRFITIATEASMGVTWPDLEFREIYDSCGTARLEFMLYWLEENENPALQRFFTLINERCPI